MVRIQHLSNRLGKKFLLNPQPIPALPPGQPAALALPVRKANRYRGFATLRPCARVPSRGYDAVRRRLYRGRGETMIEIYGTTFARIGETKRGMLVRRLAGFHTVVDLRSVEDGATRLWLDDGSTITLGEQGLVEVAR